MIVFLVYIRNVGLMNQAATRDKSILYIFKLLGSLIKTGMYGDFDFGIMAAGKERKNVQNL